MFKVIAEGRLPGDVNMAQDRQLLARAEKGESLCRVYSWDGPWVSLGYWQNPERDLLPGCPARWVMRPTGGKAVLHGHDVTVGLACPLASLARPEESVERLAKSVKTVYRRLAVPLVQALMACGVPAALAEDTPFVSGKGHTADCFAHISANDIVDSRSGLKVCGCALRLTATAVLVQASIPNGSPLVDPHLVYEKPAVYNNKSWDASQFPDELRTALNIM